MPDFVGRHASRAVWRIIGRLAFNRITVVGRERLPRSGAVLYVATHRNGALDGAPYIMTVPSAVIMVSAQLHRSALGRFLFRGIPVARAKDRKRGIVADNQQSVDQCVNLLKTGGQLLIMPEGTSTLGCGHLPFRRGAANIAHAALAAGARLSLVPLGVHYEDPTVWQSRVEVLVGEPAQLSANDDVDTIHQVVTQGLETVGASFPTDDAQRNAQALAYACTLGRKVSYALTLKNLEQTKPETVAGIVQPLVSFAHRERLCLHQGVPLVPVMAWPLYAIYWLVLAPFVAGFCLVNAPALAAGYIASRKLPDEPNVISFWRIVAGLPVGVVWSALATTVLAFALGFGGVAAYWGVTVGGIGAWYRFRKLSVALCNGLFHAGAKPGLLNAYREIQDRNMHG